MLQYPDVAARAIARRVDFSGTVFGIDPARTSVTAAQRLAREEGIDERLDFRTGDARAVEATEATFDAVIAHTLVSDVEDPSLVVERPYACCDLGLELVVSFPHVLSEIGLADFWSSAIEAYRRLIPKAGVMTEDEANARAAAPAEHVPPRHVAGPRQLARAASRVIGQALEEDSHIFSVPIGHRNE